jgi:hypothetical protein
VNKDSWYAKAVLWSYKNKIIQGKGAKKFDPAGPITRAEMSKIVILILKYLGK